jgi:hypothetical protein
MFEHVGGGDHAHNLLPPLELLLTVGTYFVQKIESLNQKTIKLTIRLEK